MSSHGPLISRRNLLGGLAGLAVPKLPQTEIPVKDGIPQVDYHAHPSADLSFERLAALSRRRGVTFGLAMHAGDRRLNARYWGLISNDQELDAWLKKVEHLPVLKGFQAECGNWMSCFSKPALAKLDYIFNDALTMEEAGRLIHIWTEEFQAPNPDKWMDAYVDHHVRLMATQPLDIFANPGYLPDRLLPDFDRLWTPNRWGKIVDAAVKYNVALEINTRYRVPRWPMLRMAHEAGCRFTFGSNIHEESGIGDISYGTEMYRRLGLTQTDFWTPSKRKPV